MDRSDPDGLHNRHLRPRWPAQHRFQLPVETASIPTAVSNPTNIGIDSATYTLTNSEVGQKVLVEVSFTDSLTVKPSPWPAQPTRPRGP